MSADPPSLRKLSHWIDGRSVEPVSGRRRTRYSPRDGEPVHTVAEGAQVDVERAVESSAAAFPDWSDQRPIERGRVLAEVARALRAEVDQLSDWEAEDSGRTPAEVRNSVLAAAAYFEMYAGLVTTPNGERIDLGPGYHAYTVREPYGVVGVVTPWNAALNQAARATAPALAVGNAVVVKPSEFTSSTTVEMARIATAAGLPPGVLNVVTGTGPAAGATLVEHPVVRKIAFTGSVATGRAIGRVAADRVVPVTLELGGKSANVVFADADLERAVAGAVTAFTYNAGQICIAGSRLLVEDTVVDRFTEMLVAAVRRIRPGVDMGPIITEDQFRKVQDYFAVAAAEGAVASAGGTRVDRAGQFVQPTVYTGVSAQMRIAREEVFGPVACVLPFSGEQQAVAMANDSDYGLVAGLWTRDLARAHRVASRLQAGQVLVNEYLAEHIELPFGGYKASGIGREKGLEALRHYSQEKSIVVRL